MIKFVVLFFTCVIASTAGENPATILVGVFENGKVLTDAVINAAFTESINVIRKNFDKQIAPLPDIHETTLHDNEHLVNIDLTNGQLTGVETIYGTDTPRARVHGNFGILNIPFRYANYTVTYDFSATHNTVGVHGNIIAEASGYRCDIFVLVDRSTLKAPVYNAKCKNNGPINIQVEGVTSEKYLSFLVPIFKELIEDATKEELEQIVFSVIKEYNDNL